ncbi:hypothetical protein [Magnetospirillum aberrantis]|uniref:Uncharacterized protein n=1 Tax=Magnetospirillum aberrantis SpK TaxID=908842 RepID=A0A7C9QT80_9PROT|nr:hypothetical protein [Magnetospirillum aberrantis]NFV80040.1 hypothetical protein [Magnetospirillum aberrantis SpK]
MRDLHPTPCRPILGDLLAGLALALIAAGAALAFWVATLHAAAAQVGPELVVRACAADRPGICETRTYPTCDRDMVAEALAAEGLVMGLAVCRAPLVEV